MKFMIVVKATAQSEAGEVGTQDIFDAMADYHEQLARAGVLVDASGLQPTSKGWRIKWSGGQKSFTDGPFAETKELIAGYTLIQVNSREDAYEWAAKFPNPSASDGEIEVRQVYELEDFEGIVGVERFRAIGV